MNGRPDRNSEKPPRCEETADVRHCPRGWTPPAEGRRQRLLYFTRSVGFEHEAVARRDPPSRGAGRSAQDSRRHSGEAAGAEDGLSFSERCLIEMGRPAGFDVECSKDGRIFDGDLSRFDALVFYTLGDLLRHDKSNSPAMSPAGKENLLRSVAAGMPFVGLHAATDTFYGDGVDPYIAMLGGEFCGHGLQQEAAMLVTSPTFPGLCGLAPEFRLFEEWYVFKKLSHEMHVILALDTRSMQGNLYDRPPVPACWARMHGKGRVFYTSLGHREEVWHAPPFRQIVYAGLAWALGNVDADVASNFDAATPGGDLYRPVPLEPGCVSR